MDPLQIVVITTITYAFIAFQLSIVVSLLLINREVKNIKKIKNNNDVNSSSKLADSRRDEREHEEIDSPS